MNPTLTSLSVAPTTVSLIEGNTQQISATGTYDDGSTKDLTGSADWSSSDTSVATVAAGLVKAAATITNPPGTATITATSGTVSATSTVTVNTGPLLSIAITASTLNPTAGTTFTLTAMGTFSGSSQLQDITSQVSWNNDNTTAVSLSQGSGSATANTGTSGQIAHIFATLDNINSNTVTITVQ
ncbi:MAG: Ig-like domain-containing protein [Terriglobales bacterium]|nr:Ig-like domain-containing protein [Terriglobales bacterium]